MRSFSAKVARRQLSTQSTGSAVALKGTRKGYLAHAGPGGRHSRSGQTVAIFGATGFIGRYVVNELGKGGCNMVVATRGDDMSFRHLKPCADYGKLVPAYISIKDESSVREAIRGCDTVINMMGKYYETKHYFPTLINCSYDDVHVKGAELVARIAREEDVKHLVHVSCAYAKKNSDSVFAHTKAVGEEKVAEQFPGAVIIRPNVVYGEEDRFLNGMANLATLAPYAPLIDGGAAKLWPTYVGDVGRGIAAAAENYSTAGNKYNLSGNHEYTMKQVFEYVMQQTGREKSFVDIPRGNMETIAKFLKLTPNPLLTDDQVRMMVQDCPSASEGWKTYSDLGLPATADFENKAFSFIFRFKQGGHFASSATERVQHS